jgi:hypothetical protein
MLVQAKNFADDSNIYCRKPFHYDPFSNEFVNHEGNEIETPVSLHMHMDNNMISDGLLPYR